MARGGWCRPFRYVSARCKGPLPAAPPPNGEVVFQVLETLLPYPGQILKILHALELPVCFPVLDDGIGRIVADTVDAHQLLFAGAVQIYPSLRFLPVFLLCHA